MNRIIIVALLFGFSGCATTYWNKSGASQMDFAKDQNDCLVKAGQAGFRGGDIGADIARANFISQCLYGAGWTQTSN